VCVHVRMRLCVCVRVVFAVPGALLELLALTLPPAGGVLSEAPSGRTLPLLLLLLLLPLLLASPEGVI